MKQRKDETYSKFYERQLFAEWRKQSPWWKRPFVWLRDRRTLAESTFSWLD